ncbi:MAG: prepilin peptidase [Chloroflexi bacterium]|nr:prepilin peptidase [Chloroflexota bacterium]
MDLYYAFASGVIGLAVGSFLNVCIDRIPAGKSLVYPPSHCDACHVKLGALDLIPVGSYLALRGRCRYCSARIPLRSPLVELLTGAMFTLAWASYGFSYQGIALMGYASFFLVIFFIDMEHQIIPNTLVYPGFAAAMVVASFWPEIGPAKAAIGAGVGFGVMLALYVVPGAVIGEGDVKLAALVGAAVGFPLVVIGVGLSFVLGGAFAAALIATRKKGRKQRIAFGPFIAASAMIALVWGDSMLRWYLETILGV